MPPSSKKTTSWVLVSFSSYLSESGNATSAGILSKTRLGFLLPRLLHWRITRMVTRQRTNAPPQEAPMTTPNGNSFSSWRGKKTKANAKVKSLSYYFSRTNAKLSKGKIFKASRPIALLTIAKYRRPPHPLQNYVTQTKIAVSSKALYVWDAFWTLHSSESSCKHQLNNL